MKLSKSLLKDKDFGQKIYSSGILKSQKLLTQIFDLDFNGKENKILEIKNNSEDYIYELLLNITGRNVKTVFTFEHDKNLEEDLLTEVLKIQESQKFFLEIKHENGNVNFKTAINLILDELENVYDINFVTLDPAEIDENIKFIEVDEAQLMFESEFTSPDYESTFKVSYKYEQDKPIIVQINENKEHIIYLE